MDCVEILSPGDKIKLLRRKYKLKQEEISGGKITRNLISEIETNKASLTRNTAEIIFDNLNILSKKYKFDITETVDYLMEDELYQANKILNSYINELKSVFPYKDRSFSKKLKIVESFLIKWDIKDKKIQIYELAGDYFSSINDYYKGALYYEKAFNLMDKLICTEELLGLLKKLSKVYAYTNKHNESIECAEFALDHFPNMPNYYKALFLYNSSISFKKLKQYNKAIKNLEASENYIDKSNLDKLIEIWNNKGTCFLDLKEYKRALEIFLKIFKLVEEKTNMDEFMMTITNLIECYIGLNDSENTNKYLRITLDNLQDYLNSNSEYCPEVCCELGDIFKNLNDLKNAEIYYSKALKFSKEEKLFIEAKRAICNLIDICTALDNVEKIDELEIETFILSNFETYLNNNIMYKLINFYSTHNMNAKINRLCKLATNYN
ncbi:XRE family transcriptional regulator [Clostridium neuense]|uniref:XRE family transcriptional regulator n=1 Tax=Clostridium neuense TaxID=1728934 RepID=A0ABW8TI07_9CLOT